MNEGTHHAQLRAWIAADPWRMACLRALAEVAADDGGPALPDAWIGAGFLRSLVWDRQHGFPEPTPLDDVDVVYFDPAAGAKNEPIIETRLRALLPDVPWSARNQARMHERNGDPPYRDTEDALRHWLETPTAVAARLEPDGELALIAPFGLDDLFAMTLRPTPHARARRDRLEAYRLRLREKAWDATWPGVRVEAS